MSEYSLISAPPLAGYAREFGDTRLAAIQDLAIVSLALPLGQEDAALSAIETAFGAGLPEPGRSVLSQDVRLVRLGVDQALVLFTQSAPGAENVIRTRIDGAAYTTDQSDVWVGLSLSGSGALAALERICPLDLHDAQFPVDAAARTVMEHLGVLIIRTDAEEWLLLSASSSARSFLHALEVSLVNTAD